MRGVNKKRSRTPLQHLARRLRQDQTEAERKLWYWLRSRCLRGAKFRRQVPIGPYIVNFTCLEARLVVELDGGQPVEQSGADATRTDCLHSRGLRVLRFWNNESLGETEAVLHMILEALNPLPQFSPLGRGEGTLDP